MSFKDRLNAFSILLFVSMLVILIVLVFSSNFYLDAVWKIAIGVVMIVSLMVYACTSDLSGSKDPTPFRFRRNVEHVNPKHLDDDQDSI